ncbi:translesion DNA synthesis-associated protein ImuA [Sphaerotilaceae bacterium SBD11-9]
MDTHRQQAFLEPPNPPPDKRLADLALPPAVRAAVWQGDQIGVPVSAVVRTGFAPLDAELPGHGWPCHALTEVLQAQPGVAEWRLLGPAIRGLVNGDRQIVLVGPPRLPHLPGLSHVGVDERRLVWFKAEAPAERLWITEQLIKSNAAGLIVSWLPQARQEQIRRLQICAQSCEAPVFLCRPESAQHEPSAAPLRVHLKAGLDWTLQVQILKRKGPTHEGVIALRSVPGGLESILTPRLRQPSLLIAARKAADAKEPHEVPHVVGSPASRQPARSRVGTH